MNAHDVNVLSTKRAIKFWPAGETLADGGYFTLDGVAVTDEGDHASLAEHHGMNPAPPLVAPAAAEPEPKRSGNGRRTRSKED